jgi:hypothetical protein
MRTVVIVQQKTNRVIYLERSLPDFSQQMDISIVLCICLLEINNDNNVNANKKLVSYNTIKN